MPEKEFSVTKRAELIVEILEEGIRCARKIMAQNGKGVILSRRIIAAGQDAIIEAREILRFCESRRQIKRKRRQERKEKGKNGRPLK